MFRPEEWSFEPRGDGMRRAAPDGRSELFVTERLSPRVPLSALVDAGMAQLDVRFAMRSERLEDAQELLLQIERELADLVEEQGAAVGELEGTLAALVGAGERPLLVAEELSARVSESAPQLPPSPQVRRRCGARPRSLSRMRRNPPRWRGDWRTMNIWSFSRSRPHRTTPTYMCAFPLQPSMLLTWSNRVGFCG
jgi:hypothetical protein